MKHIWAIFKKELKRFFTDSRMLIALIVPGILIFVIYSLMGNVFSLEQIQQIDKAHQFNIAITDNYNSLDKDSDNKPIHGSIIAQGITALFGDLEYEKEPNFIYINKEKVNEYKNNLISKEIDALIEYKTDDFEKVIFNPANPLEKPNVNVYYNSESKESEILFSYINQIMSIAYSNYTINLGIDNPNVGKSSAMMNQVIGIMLPMLTISIIYSITITVCPEAVAGEKERGTLASILITPIKRHEFALGKVLALSVVSLFGGVITGTGMIASLPSLLKGSGMSFYLGGLEYTLIFFIMLSLMFLFVNFATMLSTFAKTTKEATGMLGPMSVIFMLFGIVPGIVDCSSIGFAFAPILGSSQALFSVINGTINPAFLTLAMISNIVYALIFVLIDVKLFKTESVVMRT